LTQNQSISSEIDSITVHQAETDFLLCVVNRCYFVVKELQK
jgi:hypothetical protein